MMNTTPVNNSSPQPVGEPTSLVAEAATPGTGEAPIAPVVTAPVPGEAKPSLVETQVVQPLTLDALKFPDNVVVADEIKSSLVDIMNNDKFSPAERAQALIDLQAGVATKAAEAQEKLWADTQEQWANDTKADKDIGGDKLAPALGSISKIIDEYGSKELREVFTLTGAGNNVHMVKFLANIAKQLTEGGAVSGAPSPQAPSLASKLFPTMN